MSGSILVAQITDTHLLTYREDRLRGVPPWSSLQAVLAVVAQARPHLLLLTGDLADAGEAAAYHHLVDLVQPLGIPTYWLAGNHDDSALMARLLNCPPLYPHKSLAIGGWQLLLLNSVLPDSRFGEGVLALETLHWLEAELKAARGHPTLLALHHPPIPVGVDWLDQIKLTNAPLLLELLAQQENVRLVLFGHIHATYQYQQGAIHFYGCPSSCTQVLLPNALTPEAAQPGFRLLRLYPDGSHQTEVRRVRICCSCCVQD
ncbi:metallophosphoesterase [Anthocerotibacter panamensis]|uniref:metallophosphoesterase n=1 Tax=Anthocerotibacter panamensis TaxID=2857077 RepID=UPI001C40502C|nr:metallophosphoesterase [Anthocerotibacter panamensis]